jgi:hypothetical protein
MDPLDGLNGILLRLTLGLSGVTWATSSMFSVS